VTPDEFRRTQSRSEPPTDLTAPLAALWWAARGDWDRSHRIVMDEPGRDAAWVHAYLHRLEGDRDNAAYWYRQAGQPIATGALEVEWDAIVRALLARQ
jgi:hypothetical protein